MLPHRWQGDGGVIELHTADFYLAQLGIEGEITMYEDNDKLEGSVRQTKVGKRGEVAVSIPKNGAVVIIK